MIAGLLGAFVLVGIETLPRCNLYSCEQKSAGIPKGCNKSPQGFLKGVTKVRRDS